MVLSTFLSRTDVGKLGTTSDYFLTFPSRTDVGKFRILTFPSRTDVGKLGTTSGQTCHRP